MSFNNIKFEMRNEVAFVGLNRVKQLNALSVELFVELKDLLISLKLRNGEVKALVLTGEGGKAFAAGADIKQMAQMTQVEALDFSALAQEVTILLEDMPFPTIVAVDGFAFGGGCEMAMACDFIYATKKSLFGQPEVTLGLIPGFGGCVRLARYIGLAKAKELIYTGRKVPAEEAEKIGLVNNVFIDREQMFQAIETVIDEMRKNSPFAIGLAKQVVNAAIGMPTEAALRIEQEAFAAGFTHPEKEEGVSAFIEKRAANF